MTDHPEPPDRPVPPAPRPAVQRWRLVLERDVLEGDTGQREQLAAWEHALTASGLPLAGLDSTPPKPRFALAAPLGAAIPGEAELADIWLTERLPVWRVRGALAASVPPAYRLVDVGDVWLGEPALPGQVVASVYRATFATASVDWPGLDVASRDMLEARTLPRERQKGPGVVGYDLRLFLDGLDVLEAIAGVRMTLRHDPARGIGRPEEVLAAIGERMGVTLVPVSLVREGLVLARPPVPAPPVPRAGIRGRPRTPPTPTVRHG